LIEDVQIVLNRGGAEAIDDDDRSAASVDARIAQRLQL